MKSDNTIKNAIKQIAAVKGLLKTETKNGATRVLKGCSELGDFKHVDGKVQASRYGDMGMQKEAFDTEEQALNWITED